MPYYYKLFDTYSIYSSRDFLLFITWRLLYWNFFPVKQLKLV